MIQDGLKSAGELVSPEACVIWLHGLGATADDFVPAVPYLNIPADLKVKFLFPQAPVRPVTINAGWEMPAWYDILEMLPERKIVQEHLEGAARDLHRLTQEQIASGIPACRIFWAGFSQGGAVVLEAAVNKAKYPDSVLPDTIFALSTYQALPVERSSDLSGLNFWHAHGSYDDVVPFGMGKKAFESTEAISGESQWHVWPMSHEVCLAELEAMGRYMTDRIGSAEKVG
ncbi:alpha/beta hydrolase [Oceanospirillum sediminis]|uniref:Carboxylesterase n=1 Tax=Oceanospirillum sediminis TaxID=2760088 RepID=A0A839IPX4_9GAMM|nr:carboxylesterase [Oceanospirillum sediminis]MBB1486286.1 carboxylesterase [Oceanospirillum sediminis]